MARPPARLAMISSSRWSCASASNVNEQRTPAKRTNVIRRMNTARINKENIAPRPAMRGWYPAETKVSHTALHRATYLGNGETSVLTLSHREGGDRTADSLTSGKIALDGAIHFTLQLQDSVFEHSARNKGSKHVTKSRRYSGSCICAPSSDGPPQFHYPAYAA